MVTYRPATLRGVTDVCEQRRARTLKLGRRRGLRCCARTAGLAVGEYCAEHGQENQSWVGHAIRAGASYGAQQLPGRNRRPDAATQSDCDLSRASWGASTLRSRRKCKRMIARFTGASGLRAPGPSCLIDVRVLSGVLFGPGTMPRCPGGESSPVHRSCASRRPHAAFRLSDLRWQKECTRVTSVQRVGRKASLAIWRLGQTGSGRASALAD